MVVLHLVSDLLLGAIVMNGPYMYIFSGQLHLRLCNSYVQTVAATTHFKLSRPVVIPTTTQPAEAHLPQSLIEYDFTRPEKKSPAAAAATINDWLGASAPTYATLQAMRPGPSIANRLLQLLTKQAEHVC